MDIEAANSTPAANPDSSTFASEPTADAAAKSAASPQAADSAGPGTPSVNRKEYDNSNGTDNLKLVMDLNKNSLIQGLIMSEILGSPRAKRRRGNIPWNSRF